MIDYDKILKQAAGLQISPYILVKREIRYRKTEGVLKNCGNCCNSKFLTYRNGDLNIPRLQCSIIGESKDRSASIDKNYICDYVNKKIKIRR
jgi:uncharacterized cysteine cluster protein YcgN (CxxCxxCC family)